MKSNHGEGIAVDIPEIDPELAELEANAPTALAKKMAASIVQSEAAKATPHKTGPGTHSTRDQRRFAGRPRRVRRKVERSQQDPGMAYRAARPHARLGGAKLVKSEAQKASEERAAVRKFLLKVKTLRLIVECPEAKLAVPYFRNVWLLCSATTEAVRAVPGLGIQRRRKLRAYLLSKNIPVSWEV